MRDAFRCGALLAILIPLAGGCGAPVPPTPACRDGVDNDHDGLTDWPADPGCTSPFDTDEQDPGECGDGVDNDHDGLTDWPADPGCASPDSPSEAADPFRLAACGDGVDNDGDGLTDWPNDPGCSTLHDDDETDPVPEPECHDGVDNDGDGLTDYPADPGCSSAADDDESDPVVSDCGANVSPIDISATGEARGEIKGREPSAFMGSCGGFGAERVFTYRLAGGDPVDLIASTEDPATTLDTVVYVRTRCGDAASEPGPDACNDDATPDTRASRAVVHGAAPGLYTIVVDSFGPGSLGAFHLHVTTRLAIGSPCASDRAPGRCGPGSACGSRGEGFACQ